MYLEWSNHAFEVMDRLSKLLSKNILLDVTLAAEGKSLRAHKIVLAAVSKYFEVYKFSWSKLGRLSKSNSNDEI